MAATQFETILTKLLDDNVRFVLVGAVAGLAQGMTRATYDVDVCYWRHPDNIAQLCRSLQPLQPRLRMRPAPSDFQLDVDTVQQLRDLPLETDLGDVDLLAEVAGLGSYEALLNQSEEVQLFGRQIRVLTLEALILAKQTVGRPQDLADVAALEAIRNMRKP
jgi:predicted nucleotidyltransferase